MHDDRAIQADHFVRARCPFGLDEFVVPLAHIAPPGVFDVAFQLNTQRAIVPKTIESTVDFAGLKHESTSLAERHKFFHLHAETVFKVD